MYLSVPCPALPAAPTVCSQVTRWRRSLWPGRGAAPSPPSPQRAEGCAGQSPQPCRPTVPLRRRGGTRGSLQPPGPCLGRAVAPGRRRGEGPDPALASWARLTSATLAAPCWLFPAAGLARVPAGLVLWCSLLVTETLRRLP